MSNIFKKKKIFTSPGSISNSITTGLLIHNSSSKVTPVDADEVPIADSAASFILKKVTWANIKATLKTYFDTLYTTTAAVSTQITTALAGYLPLTGGFLSGALNEAKGTNIASATTTNIGAATGNYIHITGSTTIIAFDVIQAGSERTLVFDGSLTLTHNAISLILPGAADIQTSAGDTAIFRSEGSGNWKCISYTTVNDAYISYSPTSTGTVNPITYTNNNARWKMLTRNTCHVIVQPDGTQVSNSNAMTITLPFIAANIGILGQVQTCNVADAGTLKVGTIRTRLNSNIADIFPGAISSLFTTSGNKAVYFSIIYQIEL